MKLGIESLLGNKNMAERVTGSWKLFVENFYIQVSCTPDLPDPHRARKEF